MATKRTNGGKKRNNNAVPWQPQGGIDMTTPRIPENIPECLRDRPVDPRRQLPIPYVHDTLDGRWDFTVALVERLNECILGRLCGQCGKPLGRRIAFVGGPISASTHAYNDAPMHEECALAALGLCPHINRANMKRAKKPRLKGTRFRSPSYAYLDRPPVWVMTVARDYRLFIQDGGAPLFLAGEFKKMRGWRNRDDGPGLVEISRRELVAALRAAKQRVREERSR
jgi:hypothetical protein